MSQFTLNNNHQLIPNSNQYYVDKKYVSIHSEDRDILKYSWDELRDLIDEKKSKKKRIK